MFLSCTHSAIDQIDDGTLYYTSGLKYTVRHGISDPHYSISTRDIQKGVFMLGPEVGFSGEVTIYDGKIYNSRIEDERIKTYHDKTSLVFNVYARCQHFYPLSFSSIKNFAQLEAKLASISDSAKLFVFKAKISQLKAHILNGIDEQTGELKKTFINPIDFKVLGVGFYSQNHRRVFTHHDSDVHVHIIDDKGHTYHLDNFLDANFLEIKYCELK